MFTESESDTEGAHWSGRENADADLPHQDQNIELLKDAHAIFTEKLRSLTCPVEAAELDTDAPAAPPWPHWTFTCHCPLGCVCHLSARRNIEEVLEALRGSAMLPGGIIARSWALVMEVHGHRDPSHPTCRCGYTRCPWGPKCPSCDPRLIWSLGVRAPAREYPLSPHPTCSKCVHLDQESWIQCYCCYAYVCRQDVRASWFRVPWAPPSGICLPGWICLSCWLATMPWGDGPPALGERRLAEVPHPWAVPIPCHPLLEQQYPTWREQADRKWTFGPFRV